MTGDIELDGTKLSPDEAAERWQRAGEAIRAKDPDAFRMAFALIEGIAAEPPGDDPDRLAIEAARRALAEHRAIPGPTEISVEDVNEIDGTKLPPYEADFRWMLAGRTLRELAPDVYRGAFAHAEGAALMARGIAEDEDTHGARVALVNGRAEVS